MSQASHQFPPLRFQPIFRSYLWGGRNLESELKKPLPSEGIWAESWEIVDHPQAQSIVSDGPWTQWSLGELVKQHRHSILGPSANHPARFPLLLKYLDCQNVLSVQVHPDDAYGATLPTPDLGKTEAWVILATNPGAKLYAGLKSGVTKSILRDAIDKGTTESCLHVINPQPGDCIFIPAGTVHALGAGLLVAEIQQGLEQSRPRRKATTASRRSSPRCDRFQSRPHQPRITPKSRRIGRFTRNSRALREIHATTLLVSKTHPTPHQHLSHHYCSKRLRTRRLHRRLNPTLYW